jgi:hypothetical protein
LWPPVGDFGEASNLLKQLHHYYFGSHKPVLADWPQFTCHRAGFAEILLGSPPGFWLPHPAE